MSQELKDLNPTPEITEEDLYKNVPLLQKVRDEFGKHKLDATCEFYTDKIISLLHDDSEEKRFEVYNYSKMLFKNGEYHRAAALLEKTSFYRDDLSCQHLVANCYYFSRDYQAALNVLRLINDNITFIERDGTLNDWKSAIELLRGRLYQKLDQFSLAKQCFLKALHYNINSYESFKEIVAYDVITKEEENILMEILEVTDVDNPDAIVKYLYLSEIDKNGKFKQQLDELSSRMQGLMDAGQDTEEAPVESMNTEPMEPVQKQNKTLSKVIKESSDFRLNQAEKQYLAFDFVGCLKELQKIIDEDQFNQRALLLIIGCHLELDNRAELYALGHRLVETYSETALAWYSVGCYYFRLQNIESAQKHFEKSISFDINFYPTILMMGHLYEMQSLHEKSLEIYLDLSKLMVNSHLPFLYAGVEHVHTNNFQLGEKYILKALEFAPDDPIVLHELGNLYYEKKMFQEAFDKFTQAHEIVKAESHFSDIPFKWEPLLNNLGHVARELQKYNLALEYHRSAIKLKPSCSSFIALGFVQYKMGDLQLAAKTFDQALSIDRSNVLASTLYSRIIEDDSFEINLDFL